ncbi:small integral membrane protein 1 isoform X1 [Ictalurus punctatus]|uniref:Small integral membrane protein 1 isoform X1 n=1 Tax=Ictalurus punctatus TaxID=7998 RepID=A0A9F7R063_ICTPU|nr:small integral membrane protein 1 isoform X1 [Ictalurus punctatus]
MEPNEATVQYNRWNEDNINMNVAASQTSLNGARVIDGCLRNTQVPIILELAVCQVVVMYNLIVTTRKDDHKYYKP